MFDRSAFEDGIQDMFGNSVEDSYHSGYQRGYNGVDRDVNIFGVPERGTVRGESKHRIAYKKGYREGQDDRRSIVDLELDEGLF